MASHLSIVVKLQAALDELADIRSQLAGIPDWMSELHGEYSIAKGEIDELEQTSSALAAERRGAEAMAADGREKLAHFQQQIAMVRNQREYGALLQEIDTTKEQIADSEEQTLASLERLEEIDKALAERREAFGDLDQRYAAELAKWEAEKPALEKTAGELEVRVAELEQELPRGVLAYFKRVLEKHAGRALAAVHEAPRTGKGPQLWHCGACNFRVRPQAVVEIAETGGLVLCDSCRRILYLPDETG